MAALTDRSAQGLLNAIFGKSAFPTLVTPMYLGLFTAVGVDAGTGFTEAAYTGYARQPVSAASINAASGSAPSTISNNAAYTFPACTAGAGVVETEIAWGLFDAVTAGNLMIWEYLGNFAWLPFSCTSASPGVLSAPAHGFSNGDSVVVTNEYGGVLPTTGGSWAGLKTVAGVTTDTLTAGVNTTGTGNGMVRKVSSQAIVLNLSPQVAAAALTSYAA